MGSDGATTTFAELEGQVGFVAYHIKDLRVFTPRPVQRAKVVVKYVGDNGKHIPPPTGYELPEEFLELVSVYAGEAAMDSLTIKVNAAWAGNERKHNRRTITYGTAFISKKLAEIYWRNIRYGSRDELTRRKHFLSTTAHEVGHLVHYYAVGKAAFCGLPRVEREYAAEKFVGLVLGSEYVRPVQEHLYKGY